MHTYPTNINSDVYIRTDSNACTPGAVCWRYGDSWVICQRHADAIGVAHGNAYSTSELAKVSRAVRLRDGEHAGDPNRWSGRVD